MYTISFHLSRGDGSLTFVILSIAKNPGLDPSAFGVRMTQEGGAFPSAFDTGRSRAGAGCENFNKKNSLDCRNTYKFSIFV